MATRKKTTKKKTTARKRTASSSSAGAKRPNWKVDIAKNKALTERKSMFFKFPVGSTRVRVLPPMDNSGLIFTKTALHYKVKTDTNAERFIAPACLREHGDGNCYICSVVEWLKKQDDALLVNQGDDLRTSFQTVVQAYVYDKELKQWQGPKILTLSGSVLDSIRTIMSMDEDSERESFTHPIKGQSLMITRTGTGKYDTRYQCQATGQFSNFYDEVPDWETQAFKNVYDKLDVKVLDIDEQKRALALTFPDWPWEEIEAEVG